ncbi:GspE/PulE family protein [Caenimonas koreensis]|nr:GspE/PulE family protein [Caenimonas koreensis]
MTWPLPPGWLAGVATAAGDAVPGGPCNVEIERLQGNRDDGVLAAWDDPGPRHVFELERDGETVRIPVDEVRKVTLLQTVEPGDDAAKTPLQDFNVVYSDGKVLCGQTHGFFHRRHSGLYLYLVGPAGLRAIWLPRGVIAGMHVEAAHAPVEAPATDMRGLADRIESAHHRPVARLPRALFELGFIDGATLAQWMLLEGDALRDALEDALMRHRLTQTQLDRAQARSAGMPEVDASGFASSADAIDRLPWPMAAKYRVVPLGIVGEVMYVATASPADTALQRRVAVQAGCDVAFAWSSQQLIDARLAREVEGAGQGGLSEKDMIMWTPPASGANATQDLQELLTSARDEVRASGGEVQGTIIDERSSVVRLVKRMILDAYEQEASDIHIETNSPAEQSRVRFRKDGDLEDYLSLPPDLRSALVSRIKVMSKLDIAERRRPQDGKINFADYAGIKLELRVAILPTHDSLEDVVLRLLATTRPMPLAKLGFSARDASLVMQLAQRPYGLLLACGPTGSGKTTTLHSLLAQINTDARKIWTAEDPIEITQPGLRQLQVNPRIGVTFASAMRAFLRADPDVIMIGEIRDEETSRIAIEASLTGHLVLSTLHTNNAAESIVRLLDLGMDPMNFADSLVGIVAQRLVRSLCPACRQAEPMMDAEFTQLIALYCEGTPITPQEGRERLLHAAGPAGPQRWRPVGCTACGGKGYRGRMGIYELLENGPGVRKLIQARASTASIFNEAVACGMRSLKQDALEKALTGAIDMAQAGTVFAQPSSPALQAGEFA